MRRALMLLAVVGAAVVGADPAIAGGPRADTAATALAAARAPRSELVRTRTIRFRGFRVERFAQRIGGYPVLGGEVTLASGGGERRRIAADATAALPLRLDLAMPARRIARHRAIAVARRSRHVRALRPGEGARAHLAVDPERGGALVWKVELPAERPFGDFEVLVDATTARALRTGNLLENAVGKANLYVPNPPAEQGGYARIGSGKRADHHDRNTRLLTRLRERVRLRRLVHGRRCLVGRYVKALIHKPPRAVCRKDRNWRRVKRANDAFEALMAYFHIDRTQAYIQRLGFTKRNHSAIDDRRQVAIADFHMPPDLGQDNSCYACFSPFDRKIRFGYGGVDDAEDGDVIVHEYGHSIQDNQDPGFGCPTDRFCQAGALGEGFGDYVSAMMTFQTRHLPHPVRAAYCIFDWDGTAGYNHRAAPCGRVADGSDGVTTLPQAMAQRGICAPRGRRQPDIHCVGEIWTHGLIDLRRDPVVGRRLDVDLLASQFTYVDNETFAEAVDALVDADQAIYHGADASAICAEMVGARGIAGATRCT